MEILFTVLIALAVACGLFPIVLLIVRRPGPAPDDADAPPVLGPLTEPLAAQIPLTRSGRDDIQKLLQGAGYYHTSALTEYRAVQAALTVGPLLLGLAAALMVDPLQLNKVLIVTIIVTLLGFSLPRVFLSMQRRSRSSAIARGLPLAIDLLILCLTAGQNLIAALKDVAGELRFSHPILARELTITQKQAELHSVETAMDQWASRAQSTEVNNFAALVVQSERLGTDTGATLHEMATNFRVTARQRAEAEANRTSFWMLLPSVFCFWVASAILLIGPAYLEFFGYRQRNAADIQNRTRIGMERANRVPREPVDPSNPNPTPVAPPTTPVAP